MNQGLGIVLPLVFFFLIDVTLFVNSIRQKADTAVAKLFTKLAGFVMISQGLTAITYACDYQMIEMDKFAEYLINLVSLAGMTAASYLWFEYLLLTGENTQKYLSKRGKKILFLPVLVLIAAGIPSQWTHWLFYIDDQGVYQPGTLYFLQFAGYVYYFVAIILTIRQIQKKQSIVNTLGRFFLFLIPTAIGTFINTRILRGGYTQIGCSYAVFLLYLEQYITEVNENKRLKSVENLNRNLQDANDSLAEQMHIVGGLSNAYFSVYHVDLENGRCRAVKVIDFFRSIVENCTITDLVVKAFLATCVMKEDREKMKDFTNWRQLSERMEKTDLLVEEFHGMLKPWEWCRASWIVAARDENHHATCVLFTVEDITAVVKERIRQEQEREETQKALKASQAAAEAANKAKTEFLFHMSHDIRTPMNAIIGYADLMEKHFGETEKCRDYLGKIRKSSGFLLSLVNNILEMARIESGKMKLEEEAFRVTDLCEQVISVYADLMKQKGITFSTDVSLQTEYCYGDRVKLSEIFLNIISNAYKYTERGGEISLKVVEITGEKPGYVIIQTTVADTGLGMSEEFLPHIFEEFSREYTSTENKIEGTGLGMPIVKRLIDFMGGTITVESTLGKGSTFVVSIPHKIAAMEDAEKDASLFVDPEKFVGKRILLVEDNELNMEIATEILCGFGFLVEQAEDGFVCIDKLTQADAGYYDLILMDVQMPNLDGYGATRKIREMKDPAKAKIPILAMTANAFEEDKQDALKAGMNGHLAKPIEINKLLETLAGIL